MPKFSVKKPFTIFVAVIAILVLGIVSYTKMTPDLLPNMDFPYVMIMTTYPGADPERVEAEITKPMEQSMSTLEHIKEVTSTSSNSYSMVVLEFEDAVNMDTIGVDIQQNINSLSGTWDEMVGVPYVLKINPSMLPVMVAGVSMKNMSNMELSELLDEKLMNELEGIPGVARISTTGSIRQELHVVLDQVKFDALNAKIRDAINDEMDEAVEELEKQKKELQNTLGQMYGMQDKMNELTDSLEDATEAAGDKAIERMQKIVDDLTYRVNDLTNQKYQIDNLRTQIADTQAKINELYRQEELSPGSVDPQQIEDLEKSLVAMILAMDEMEAKLQDQGYDPDHLDVAIDALNSMLTAVKSGMETMQGIMDSITKMMSGGLGSLGSSMSMGGSMDSAMEQIDEGFEAIEEGRADAIKQSDLNNIITMDLVSQILTAQNFSMPAGYVEQDGISYMVSVGDEITTVEELEGLLLFDMGMDDIGPIYLKDVAAVMLTDNQNDTYAKLDGENGIMLSFEKQSTYATAETANNILDRFEELEKEYPGLKFVSLMNQGDYIHLIVDSILNSLLLGALFAIIVLYLFLKDLRPTFITLCSIPISVIFAIVLMYFSGVTINMISLSGLAVAVGMLVDNSVVVIENIYRLRSNGANPIQAAVSGAQQVAGAVTSSTLATVCVFLPIVFVEGITKQLFTDLALTMTYALMASLIVSLTLVPAMASGLLQKEKIPKAGFMDKFNTVYSRIATWSLDHKAVVLTASFVLLVATALGSIARGFIFMPPMDMPNVNVTITMPEDATMEEAVGYADEVMARIDTLEGIASAGASMSSGGMLGGLMGGGGGGGSYDVTVYITLSDDTAKGSAVAKQIVDMCSDLPCEVSATSAIMDMSMLSGSGLAMNLYAQDMDTLQTAAKKAAEILRDVPGLTDISDGMEDAVPALHISIDRNKAMAKGITVAQVYLELAEKLTTTATAATLQLEGTSTDVIIEKPEGAKLTVDDLELYRFEVAGMDGSTNIVWLNAISEIEETTSLASISRDDQRRYLSVSAGLEEGYNITKVTAQAQALMEEADLGEGVTYAFAGENETIMEAIEQLFLMLLLGILLVYLVMVAQFQSLKSPFIVMFTIPLAFTGGFIALLICGMEVSVISLIGFIMLTGIIVNNGIVLVDYINQLRQEGMERRAAIIEAGTTRMRPILMTTITTILGLIDMATRNDAGTAMMQPVAVVCIGGLVYATLMTLFVVPCIYDMLNKKELRTVREEDLKMLDI